jgi:hypothetical protein
VVQYESRNGAGRFDGPVSDRLNQRQCHQRNRQAFSHVRMPPIRCEFSHAQSIRPSARQQQPQKKKPGGGRAPTSLSRRRYCCAGGLPFGCAPIGDVVPDGFCVPVADASCTKPFLQLSLNSASEI